MNIRLSEGVNVLGQKETIQKVKTDGDMKPKQDPGSRWRTQQLLRT